MAAVEYGPHETQDLPSFLRCLGPVDCAGTAVCLLLDDVTLILEAKENAEAASANVTFPVVCTADYVALHARSRYGAVERMFPLKAYFMKQLLNAIGPRLNLDPRCYSALIDSAQGDARQLCLSAVFRAPAECAVRDELLSVHESACVFLGCGDRGPRAMYEMTRGAYHLLHENFLRISGIAIEDSAAFAGDFAVIDALSAVNEAALELGARACCVWRRGRRCEVPLAKLSGWIPCKQGASLRSLFLQAKYRPEWPMRSWTVGALALHQFAEEGTNTTSGPAASSTGKSSISTDPLSPRSTRCM